MLATARLSSEPTVRLIRKPCNEWRRLTMDAGGSRLAHAVEWSEIIREAYGHEPMYLMAECEDGAGVLPAFIVRRPLLGTIVSSMPFLDSGGPCASSPRLSRALVDRLLAEARTLGARTVDIRTHEQLAIDARPADHKVNMTLALAGDTDQMWRRFDKDTRYQIRKAERSGLSVHFGGENNLSAFYGVFAARMRDLGSPVHDRRLFQAICDAFEERSRIVLVRKGDLVVGGLIAIVFKDRIVVPWAACDKEYFPLCPNMLLYWEVIRAACANGVRRFDFGRSTRNSGTYRFKAQWGAEEEPLHWYTIPVSPPSDRSLVTKLWQQVPLPITRQLGPRIRRYLIQ